MAFDGGSPRGGARGSPLAVMSPTAVALVAAPLLGCTLLMLVPAAEWLLPLVPAKCAPARARRPPRVRENGARKTRKTRAHGHP